MLAILERDGLLAQEGCRPAASEPRKAKGPPMGDAERELAQAEKNGVGGPQEERCATQ